MSEAVRTMASPAGTWAIAVTATVLALFMAIVTTFMDLRVAREQRSERKLGLGSELGTVGTQWPRLTDAAMWPPMSEALLAAAGVPAAETAEIRTGVPAADTATRSEIPAQRAAPAERPEPAEPSVAAQYAAAAAAEEPPTVPIPAQRAQVTQEAQEARDVPAGRHGRPEGGTLGGDTPTMPDLPAQQAPGQAAVPMPAQRAGESDRAERSFAGPGPQDDDEDEDEDEE